MGKTTHYKQWKRLFPNEVEMLNGDKPVLNFEKQYVTVSASPWAGKENMRQLRTAPLGGIVFLAQDKQNIIKRLSPKEAGCSAVSAIHNSVRQRGTGAFCSAIYGTYT